MILTPSMAVSSSIPPPLRVRYAWEGLQFVGHFQLNQAEAQGPDGQNHCAATLAHLTIRLTKVPRHGRARPGHPRLACGTIGVDARNKSGHDGGGFGSTISENASRRAGKPP